MSVIAQCPSCATTASVDESFSGRRVRCGKCGERFLISPELFGEPAAPAEPTAVDPAADPFAGNEFDLGLETAYNRPGSTAITTGPAPAPVTVSVPRRESKGNAKKEPVHVEHPTAPPVKRKLDVPLMLLSLIILGGAIAFFVWIDQVQREQIANRPKDAAPAAKKTDEPAKKVEEPAKKAEEPAKKAAAPG